MDNKNVWKRAQRVLDIAQAMAEKTVGHGLRNQLEDITLHDGYAEPGYDSKTGIVATGNWNTVTKWENNERVEISNLPKRIADIFEKMGIECEWSDEWGQCGNCYRLVRTSGDCYSWQPSYYLGDGELTCAECTTEDPEKYLRTCEDSHAFVLEKIDPTEHGYIKVNEDSFESGWHPGQNDNPETVAKDLRAKNISRFLFRKDEQSQFYLKWSVYVHEDEAELLKGGEHVES